MKHTASGTKEPVQIEEFKAAIRDMSNDELNNIRIEIENSLKHLRRSNARLQAYINKIEGREYHYEDNELLDDLSADELDSIDYKDLQLYSESLNENNIILKNYEERIDALNQENIFRTSGLPKKNNISNTRDKKQDTDSEILNTSEKPNSIYL
ncbi:Tma17p PWA37_000737 [Arxiozyma heterogenica]|uniref:Uncharacterized protein n=1 Tax=Arxiozyma heterogenica TaxID=278026 RepID=A0AAN8A841_9SACH|nr:hypothetical protein RI543_000620 [Kazachstania heterogenica]